MGAIILRFHAWAHVVVALQCCSSKFYYHIPKINLYIYIYKYISIFQYIVNQFFNCNAAKRNSECCLFLILVDGLLLFSWCSWQSLYWISWHFPGIVYSFTEKVVFTLLWPSERWDLHGRKYKGEIFPSCKKIKRAVANSGPLGWKRPGAILRSGLRTKPHT